jgi:chromosome partitioning protein
MDPKMIVKEAAASLDISEQQALTRLAELKLSFYQSTNLNYFGHTSAKDFFNFKMQPRSIAFQIVKGGTGKTSLASAFAVRANLYGLKVLCIDLDQQGNLTHTFNVNAEEHPVMIDILAEGYSYEQAITKVYPGLYVLASRIENALIDDVIKLKKLPLEIVYKEYFAELKKQYDLIVVDCPPNLGQSVAAVTLAVDTVVAPVVPENFALSGLKVTCNTIQELEQNYATNILFKILVNKYDARTILSQDALTMLRRHPVYSKHLLQNYIRTSQEFPNAISKEKTIFDQVKATIAKTDVDNLTKELLNIGQVTKPKTKSSSSKASKSSKSIYKMSLEESLV